MINFKPQCSGQFFLALIIVAGFFMVLYVLLTRTVPAQGNEPLLILFGMLGTAFSGVIGFYFGSSVSTQPPAKDGLPEVPKPVTLSPDSPKSPA
jgi:hypothetical protein